MATGISGKQRHSKYSKCLCFFYMLLVFFATDQSHRTPRAAEIQPMSREAAAVTRLYRGLVLDTHAPLVARGCVPQTRQWDYADNRKH